MSDVSVIGLGVMGSALARAFISDDHDVTVWNRTGSKAEPLVSAGATLAPDPAAAVNASPVIVVCVRDYEATRAILSGAEVGPHLSGRFLVQLSSGTPREAREMERWARDRNSEYLDGSIQTYPDQMGTPEGGILLAGSEATFLRCKSLLQSLATLQYLDEDAGLASALGLASGALLYGALLGILHGVRICEVEGVRAEEFSSILAEFIPTLGDAATDLCERIQNDRFDESQATLQTGADGAELILQQARDSRIDRDFPEYVANTLKKGVNDGLGSEDMAALIKVWRKGAQPPRRQSAGSS